MKTRSLLILLFLAASLIPVYFFNRYMQSLVKPRKSLQNLFAYIFIVLAFIFMYTFLLVYCIKWIFPIAK